MTKKHILSIDTGSSSCKIGLYDSFGNTVALVREPTVVAAKENSSATREYDPNIWWHATVNGIQKLLATSGVAAHSIAAIGLTGQIGTHILLDSQGNSLLPAISWQDGRAAEEAAWLDNHYPGSTLDDLIGMHLPPGTAWPIPRLLWLKKHNPKLFGQPFTLLQTKDYVGYRLTGNLQTDTLSLRGLVHPDRKSIDTRISTDILGIQDLASHIPRFSDAQSVMGTITQEAASSTGLLKGTKVITGCGDFHASLVGTGIVDGSYGFNITGTSDHVGILCKAGDRQAYDVRLGKYPSIIPQWDIWYGATSAGGGSVQWFLQNFGEPPSNVSIRSHIEQILHAVPNSQGLLFLPYLNGERAPIWDAHARGSFVGIGSGHSNGHFLRAVLEGVVFSLNDCLSIMDVHQQSRKPIRISGAAAKDALWNQMKADIFGVPVSSMFCHESSSLGAAIIASVGTGMYEGIDEATAHMVRTDMIYEPNLSLKEYYEDLFGIYRNLYQALKGTFVSLAKIRSTV